MLRADIDLPRPADAPVRVVPHLFPVGDPAGQAAEGEHDGEHVAGNADGPVDNAAVKVDVGVEVALNEKLVVEGHLFQFLGYVEERVGNLEGHQHLVARLFNDPAAGVVALVYPVAEANEPEGVVGVLGSVDVGLIIAV